MAQQQIKTILFSRFNKETQDLEYLFTSNKWNLFDTDVVVDSDFCVTVNLDPLSKEKYTQLAITTLREKQSKAWADAQQTVSNLEEKIKELHLLTWQSDVLKEGDFQLKPESAVAEVTVMDIDSGEVIDLDAIQQTELDIAEGEWEEYPEGKEPKTVGDTLSQAVQEGYVPEEIKAFKITFISYDGSETYGFVSAKEASEAFKLAKESLPKNFTYKGYAISEDVADSADDYKDA
jgi:hypothetical protein